jgi:hypothetical protein
MKLAILLLVTLAAYQGVRSNGWVYEDAAMQIVAESGDAGYSVGLVTRNLSRWSVMTTAGWFGPSARVQHAVQLAVHCVNVALVLWLASALLPAGWACLAAAIFAWHPIQVETAAYVASRPDLLLTLWLLVAVNLLVWPVRWWSAVLIAGAFFLGMASKQTGAAAAPLLLAIGWWQRPTARDAYAWAVAGTVAAVGLATWGVLPVAPDALPYTGIWLAAYQSTAFLNQLRLVLVPTGFTIDHNVGIVPPSAALACLGVVCVAGAWALARLWAGDRRPVGWLLLWPLLLLAPRFLLSTPEFTNSHQLYPAMPAIAIGLVVILKGLYERLPDVSAPARLADI